MSASGAFAAVSLAVAISMLLLAALVACDGAVFNDYGVAIGTLREQACASPDTRADLREELDCEDDWGWP